MSKDSSTFKEAMSRFPSGVTIVTTVDSDRRWWGFTANAFCSVSSDPPLVLVCLANDAECRPAFAGADRWNIHVIHADHQELAMRFATRGADKFAGADFFIDAAGIPRLPQACVALHCRRYGSYVAGDHVMLIGEVEQSEVGDTHPTLYYRRDFHALPS